MTSSTTGEIGVRSHGWSPELLTLLGAVLAIGVGLAGLMFNFQGQVREDMGTMETRLREDMGMMETRLREELMAVETRLRGEMKAMEMRIIKDLDRRARIREECGHVSAKTCGRGKHEFAKTCANCAVMSASSASECRTSKDASFRKTLRRRGRAKCPERLRPDSTSTTRLAMAAHLTPCLSQFPAMCPALGEIDLLLTGDIAASHQQTRIEPPPPVWPTSGRSRR